MPDLTPFELRLHDRLEAELDRGPAAFDAAAIARAAMVRRSPWDQLRNRFAPGTALPMPTSRRALVVAVTALVALAIVAVAAGLLASGAPRLALVTSDWDIVVAAADGTHRRIVGQIVPSAPSEKLALAPAGEHLAFEGDDRQLTIVDRSGTVTYSRTLDSGLSTFAWSPDGSRLAILDGPLLRTGHEASGPLGGPVVHPHLDVIAPDGGTAWSAPLPEAFRYPLGQGARPAWSPDGRLIAITGFEDTGAVAAYPSTVWIIDTEAQSVRELTAGSAPNHDYIPSWTRDGRLLISRLSSGIWAIDPSTGSGTQVYAIPSPGPCDAESCAGNLITTLEPSPDGSAVAMIVPNEGLVVLDLVTGEARQPRMPDGFAADVPIRWTDGAALVMRIGDARERPFFATQVGRLDLVTGELTILASDVFLFDLRSS